MNTIPTTLEEIVADILKSMPKDDKTTIVTTAEDDLIRFHDGWGRGIRNAYDLWHNYELVEELGADHPDEASMIIIKAVWKALQESGSH